MAQTNLTSCMLVADIHLNDNPQDEYRWGLFKWLRQQAAEYKVRDIAILGDLTDSKDRHSAKLVNRLMRNLTRFKQNLVVIKGNHDYVDPLNPFFSFASYYEDVDYFISPAVIQFGGCEVLILPHSLDPETEWQVYFDSAPAAAVAFAHQTVKNALGDNGQPLPGVSSKLIKQLKMPVFSGDVHVAQTIGPLEYVGAPYAIKFGDKPTRSAIVFDDKGERHDLEFPSPAKRILRISNVADLDRIKVDHGDMVQFQVSLAVEELAEAASVRGAIDQFVSAKGLTLMGSEMVLHFSASDADVQLLPDVSMSKALETYAKVHGLSDELLGAGRELLKKASRTLATE